MEVRVPTATLDGINAVPAEIVCRPDDRPGIRILGEPDYGPRETTTRVRMALRESGLDNGGRGVAVGLAPAAPMNTELYDLAISLAILVFRGHIPREAMTNTLTTGSLGPQAVIGGIRGMVAIAKLAATQGATLLGPAMHEQEVRFAGPVHAHLARTLPDLVFTLRDKRRPELFDDPSQCDAAPTKTLDEIRGYGTIKQALTIAAAGGRHTLFAANAGADQRAVQACARRSRELLGKPTETEWRMIVRLRSIAGTLDPLARFQVERPFRAPHYSVSAAALSHPREERPGTGYSGVRGRPAEANLAHGGVLYLQDIDLFDRNATAALRTPALTGATSNLWPARALMLGEMTLTGAGQEHDEGPDRLAEQMNQSQLKDVWQLQVLAENSTERRANRSTGWQHEEAVRRIRTARHRQNTRYDGGRNGYAHEDDVRAKADPDQDAKRCLDAVPDDDTTNRHHQTTVIRIARTIADLNDRDQVTGKDVDAAIAWHLGGSWLG